MSADTSLTTSIDQAKRLMVEGRDLPWLLRRQADSLPDKKFLIWEPFTAATRSWTYAQFHADVVALAGGLHSRGVGYGDRVMIHLDNSPEFMLSWFACAHLGAIAVSTNTRAVARDMTYYAEHAGITAAITSPGHAQLVVDSAPGIELLAVTDNDAGEPGDVPAGIAYVRFADLLSDTTPPPPDRVADPMADLGIQFTSGTTSRPKAVLWTHANAIWGAEVNVAHMRLQPDDVTLLFLPLFHTNAQSYSMLATLWAGGSIVLQPRFSASRFWDVSLRNGVTWCSLIPFCVKALQSSEVPADHLYRFWGCGAQLPEVETLFGIKTMAWWGMTETITHGIIGSLEQPGPRMWIGRPSPAYDISIRRPDGTPISAGERGELFIRGVRGVSLFKEYYRNAPATADAFDDDGWFDTGDLIRMDGAGNLFFSDRSKDMLKVGAENVAASEIETVIMHTGLVAECAVVGQRHAMLDEVPVAFVIPRQPAPADLAELVIAACRQDLADFKVPRFVYVVDELPRSTLEKIAKNELRQGLPIIER